VERATDVVALADLTWQEAEERLKQRPIGLFPVGAVEAHGPHLPLDTDLIIASAMARRAAKRLAGYDVPALILPAINYTVSFVGASFAGTSPVAANPLESYLASALTHLARQGYRAIILCNAHLEPAHIERLHASCRAAEAVTHVPVRCPDIRSEPYSALLSDEFRAGSRHAGSYETSIVMAARPEAVRADALKDLPPVWVDLPAKLQAGARTFAEAGAELGYFGNPASATPEEGRRMLNALAEIVIKVCRDARLLPAEDAAPAAE
jgi:creatinine amidohydrolase